MSSTVKKKPVILCVNSVKGGAGKTTFSLSCLVKVLEDLSVRNAEDVQPSASMARVCYVDADLIGTGARHIIYTKETEPTFFNEETTVFSSVVKEIVLNGLTKKDRAGMYCVLLSDDPIDKERYINDPRRVLSTAVRKNLFLNQFKKLIDYLIDKENFDFIVIDCSPGYDDIPIAIYRYLANNYDKNRVFNTVLTTTENSHVTCTLKLVLQNIGLTEAGERMHLVVNDLTGIWGKEQQTIGINKEDLIDDIREGYSDLVKSRDAELPTIPGGKAAEHFRPSQLTELQVYTHDYTKFAESLTYNRVRPLDNTPAWKDLYLTENTVSQMVLDILKSKESSDS